MEQRPADRTCEVCGELYYEHAAPSRGLHSKQYAYEIGSYHYNWHPAVELLLILTGEVEVCASGAVSLLRPGDLVVINSNEGHATLATRPQSIALLLHLDTAYLAGFEEGEGVPRFACRSTPLTRSAPAFVKLRRLLTAMMLQTVDLSPAGIAAYERDLLDIVATLFRDFPSTSEGPAPADNEIRDLALRRAVAYVDRHFRERISLKRLGDEAGYNPGYVSELFSQHLGMTSSEYIRRVRLARAVRDLGDTTKRVVDIAEANGFPDIRAFNVAFHRAFGKTPTAYRRSLRDLSDELSAVDAEFHKRYVSRDDAEVRMLLEAMAEAPGGSSAGLSWTGPDALAELDQLAAAARVLAGRLAELTGSADQSSVSQRGADPGSADQCVPVS